MASFFNVTGNLQTLLNNFGIGNTWELAEGKLVFPTPDGRAGDRDTTITFVDVSKLAGLDLSVFPTLELATSAIRDYLTKSGADRSGSTNTLESNVLQQNNIISYQLPNGVEIVRSYGTKATQITLKIVLNQSSYLDKLQKLYQLSSQNTGFTGITLYHPTLGVFNNCQIKSLNANESGTMFKGSVIDIQLTTSSVFNPTTVPAPSPANTVLGYIQRAIGILQTLSTLVNTGQQIGVALAPLLNLAGDPSIPKTVNFSGNSVSVNFDEVSYTNPNIGDEISGSAKFTNSENTELSSAIDQLTRAGVPIDYNLTVNVNVLLEQMTQLNNIVVGGYGTGSISQSSTTTEKVASIANLVYSETRENSNGTLTIITRSVAGYDNGLYNITVTTSTVYPVDSPNLSSIKSSINKMISYLGVVSNVIPTSYSDCASLIATMENFYIYTQTSNNVVTLDRNMTLIELAIQYETTTAAILRYNDTLIGHKLLYSGMTIYIPPQNDGGVTL